VAGSRAETHAADEPRALYESHFGFVWRNLRRLGVPESSAEDAAQDVFLTVHRRYNSYDARWSRVETWLYGILIRVASDHRRARRRRRRRFDSSVDVQAVLERSDSHEAAPDEVVARHEALELLESALDTLSDKKRAVFVMVDVEQLSVPEAAEALGVNVNTAYWRLRAARKEFDRALVRLRSRNDTRKGWGRA
jgi:RNA polymerase sigma-70 factor (ECF subfamily)